MPIIRFFCTFAILTYISIWFNVFDIHLGYKVDFDSLDLCGDDGSSELKLTNSERVLKHYSGMANVDCFVRRGGVMTDDIRFERNVLPPESGALMTVLYGFVIVMIQTLLVITKLLIITGTTLVVLKIMNFEIDLNHLHYIHIDE